ncbi:MAG: hypothetical protein KDD36_08595, partial [Flavobacteriales bacterium]|nr:hypothetical protein [Flavobacteriales bacterium]
MAGNFIAFWKKDMWRRIIYFFPIQLLILLIKKNHLLVLFWVILFGFVTGQFMQRYGIPYLFLDPEYMGKVDFWSYLFMGLASGGFIMAFHITNYIGNSFRFPFLATLSRPFWKFSINNSTIPLIFCLYYSWMIVEFQADSEFVPWPDIVVDVAGYLLGNACFIAISFLYFFRTNKDLYKMFGIRVDIEQPDEMQVKTIGSTRYVIQKHDEATPIKKKKSDKEWTVETYMSAPFRVRLARKSQHYDRGLLNKVFLQNHMNAALYEVVIIIILIVLGMFREVNFF